ncbi:MAG: SpoIIE family protein phosphatase [Chloroflexi bacterium]|nr:SpoIIE family protein phosphatase [Chloroflexota bacterium]
MLTVEVGIAKTNKYASRDSGDTAEIVERPGGGLSVVLVDGQGSGAAAKMLSNALAGKAVALLKEGARDGAVARATHDYLHHYRGGQVSATLDIVSVDLVSRTVVVTRNSDSPMIVRDASGVQAIAGGSGPIGPRRHTRPEVWQFPVAAGLELIVFTDGIANAGRRAGSWEPLAYLAGVDRSELPAAVLADGLLAAALTADQQRANDDMTVVALTIGAAGDRTAQDSGPLIRRLSLSWPLTLPIGSLR